MTIHPSIAGFVGGVAAALSLALLNTNSHLQVQQTTLGYNPAAFGVQNPELEISNHNPASGGYKWNVASLRARSEDQFSALTFRDPLGREHGAIGWGNTQTGAPFKGTTYVEASHFPFTGAPPPDLLFIQTGRMGGAVTARSRLRFASDGRVTFYRTDGVTPLLTLDTENGVIHVYGPIIESRPGVTIEPSAPPSSR